MEDEKQREAHIEKIFPRDFRGNFRCALDGLAHARVTDPIYNLLAQSGVIDVALREQLASKEPRPAGRGFCKPRRNLSPLRYELPFLPALPSGASWQIFVTARSGAHHN